MNKDHVRYQSLQERLDLAENRFRYHGRFISKEIEGADVKKILFFYFSPKFEQKIIKNLKK